MNNCQVLPLDARKRRRAAQETELPAYSAMTADGVMVLPVERRQAEVVDCDELRERRLMREHKAGR
jgi:hypothetical protein